MLMFYIFLGIRQAMVNKKDKCEEAYRMIWPQSYLTLSRSLPAPIGMFPAGQSAAQRNGFYLSRIRRFTYFTCLGRSRMSSWGRALSQRTFFSSRKPPKYSKWTCHFCQQTRLSTPFSTSTRARQKQHQNKGRFGTRLSTALQDTKVQWKYRIPIGLGIGFLGAVQFYRVQEREKNRRQEEQDALESNDDSEGRPRKRTRIRPSGPWYEEASDGKGFKADKFLGRYRSCQLCR